MTGPLLTRERQRMPAGLPDEPARNWWYNGELGRWEYDESDDRQGQDPDDYPEED